MVAKKFYRCDGKDFDSIASLSRYYKIHTSTVARRLRDGWSVEQAVNICSKPKMQGHSHPLQFNGKTYRNVSEAALELALNPATVLARISRGMSVEDALTGKFPKRRGRAKPYEFNGLIYESLDAFTSSHGVSSSVFLKRIKRGWTIEQAIELEDAPPRFRNQGGDLRGTKWKQTRPTPAGLEPIPDSEGYKVYLITNKVNGKEYVGLTINSLENRLKQHFAAARRGKKAPLPNAIRFYGESCFDIRLLRSDAQSFEELQDQEINEIAKRNTIANGYNAAVGGGLGTAKSITVDGRRFPSRAQAAEHYGIDVTVFNIRLSRLGWTPEEAAGIVPKHWGGEAKEIKVCDKNYPSIRECAQAYGKNYRMVYDRLSKGWSIEQALELEPIPHQGKYQGIQVEIDGVIYKSIRQAAHSLGIDPERLRKKIASGITPDEAYQQLREKI